MATANRTFRSSMMLSTAMAAAFAVPGVAHAQLVNSSDLVDAVDSGGNGGQLTVTDTSATRTDMRVLAPVVVANWNRFNVPTGTTVAIENGSANAQATLVNRVIGLNASDISGTITAPDVNLWLINQNGILFGDGASISSASFVASTLDVANQDLFDFYEGTDVFANGTSTLNFSGGLGNTVETASPNVTFVTDGTMMFVSEQLNLDATFDAGTGRVSFVTAADVDVTFTPGSPLTYVVNAGTTVAQGQTIGGTVNADGGVDFAMFTASGVVDAVLRVDASVNATRALPTENGVRLIAEQTGVGTVTVELGGGITSTGRVLLDTDGDATAAALITGSGVSATTGGALTLANVAATNGGVAMRALGGDLVGGAITATDDILFEASLGNSASFASLDSSGGRVAVDGLVPGSITVTGLTRGTIVSLTAGGDLNLGNVISTTGSLFLTSLTGSLTAGDITSAGLMTLDISDLIAAGNLAANGAVSLETGNGITTTSITSDTSNITVTNFFGPLNLGNLDAAGAISIDSIGSLTTGTILAGGALTVGGVDAPNGVTFNGNVSAQSIDIDSDGALLAQNMTATGGGIALDVSFAGGIVAGNLQATGDITFETSNTTGAIFASLVSTGGSVSSVGAIPTNITVTGLTQGTSVFLVAQNSLNLGNVVATLGGVLLDSDTGSITVGNISATSTIELGAGDAINAGTIFTTDGDVILNAVNGITAGSISTLAGLIDVDSTGGGGINLGALDASDAIFLDTTGSVTTGAITAGGALTVGGTLIPSIVTFNGNAQASSISVLTSGAFQGAGLTSTAGNITLDASSIDAAALSATGGDVDLTAVGNVTTTGITASGLIDVDSTGGGALNLGTLGAGSGITLDTTGTLTTGAITAGGALAIGATVTPGTVTINGNAVAASVIIRAGTSLTAQDIEATNGTVVLSGSANGLVGNITAGNVRATGNLSFSAGNNGIAQFASLTSTGGSVSTLGTIPGVLAVSGDISGVSVNLGAVSQLLLGNVTSTAGEIRLTGFRGSVSAGNVSANGGNVVLRSAIFGSTNPANEFVNVGNVSAVGGNVTINVPGAVTTTGISASGLIDVDSTAGGALDLGTLGAGGGITLDTTGNVTTGAVTADGDLRVGQVLVPGGITFNGAVIARSITVAGLGAFESGAMTARTGNVNISALTIDAGDIAATVGNVNLLASGAITTGLIAADPQDSAGGTITVRSTTGGAVNLGVLSAGGDIALDTTGNLVAGSVSSRSGALTVGAAAVPGDVTFTGAILAQSVTIDAAGAFLGGAVTAEAGNVDIQANTITAGDLRAVGGDALLTAVGGITTGNVSATTVNSVGGLIDIESTSGGTLALGSLSAAGDLALDTTGSITAAAVTAGGALAVGGTRVPSAVTFTGVARGSSISVLTTGAFSGTALTATAGNLLINADGITAGDIRVTGGTTTLNSSGNIAAGNVASTGDIQFAASNTGTAAFASLVSSGGMVFGSGLVSGTISVTGLTRGTSVSLVALNALNLGDVISTVDGVSLVASSGSVTVGDITAANLAQISAGDTITAGDVIAQTGNVVLQAQNGITTDLIRAVVGAIDVDSLNGGALNLGVLNAGGAITLDTTGSITTAAVTAGGALNVGGTLVPSTVTFTGAARASSINVLTSGAFQGAAMTSTAGNITVDAGSINAGALSATGGDVDLAAVGNVTTTAISATGLIDVDSTGGGAVNVGVLNAGSGVTLDTTGSITTAAITAGGALNVGGTLLPSIVTFTGNVRASSITARSGGALQTAGLTATTGDITLNAEGAIATGALAANAGAIAVGLASGADSVTFGGAASARSISVLTSGAFQGAAMTSTAGNITVDAGSINAAALSATGGDVDLTAVGNVTTTAITASGLIDVDSTSGGALNVGVLNAGSGITLDTTGSITTAAITAGGALNVGGALLPSIVTFTGNVRASSITTRSGGALQTAGLTATTGNITLNAEGAITTGAVTAANGAIAVGLASNADSVTVGGSANARSISVLTSGAFQGAAMTSTAGNITVDAGSISATALSATGGIVDLMAVGNVTTTDITATGLIDVDSTGGGALNLGTLGAGGAITLDTTGSITTAAITAGGALNVGGALLPSIVTFTGNVHASSITARSSGAFQGAGLTSTAGSITVDAGSINAGALSATGGGVDLSAVGNVVTTGITATGLVDVDSTGAAGDLTLGNVSGGLGVTLDAGGDIATGTITSTGGAIAVGLASAADSVTFGGAASARSISVLTNGAFQGAGLTSTAGNITVDAGSINAGALSATGGGVDLSAVGNVVTTGITATGLVDVDSTGAAGDLTLGNVSGGLGVTLDAGGDIATGTVTSTGGAIAVGLASAADSVTFGGAASARSISVLTNGAFQGAGMTSTAGNITVDAGSINTAALSATGGGVDLSAAGNVVTAGITATGAVDIDSATGNLTLGMIDAGLLVDLDAAGAIAVAAIASQGGAVLVDGRSIAIAGATSATGGDVRMTAVGNITTGAVSAIRAGNAGGAIDIESTGTGANAGMLNLGALMADLGIELDAKGAIATQALTARNGAVDIDGATIAITGATSATGGDVKLLAAGNITTGTLTSASAANLGGAIDIDSTNAGALSLGAMTAARGIALDTLGTVTTAAVTAGANLVVGGTRLASAVNFGGPVQAANITVDTSGTFTAGTMAAGTGTIDIAARDVQLGGAVSAGSVILASSVASNDTATPRIGLGTIAGVMSLTDAELDLITAGRLVIDAGSGNVGISGVSFRPQTGSTDVVVATTGTIAITGDISGDLGPSGTVRTFRFGGNAGGTDVAARITADIDAATINLGKATLALRGNNIVFGQQALITQVGTLTLDQQVKQLIGNAGSLLYTPANLSAKRLSNPAYLTAGSMSVTYGGSALFQNSAPIAGANAFDGVALGGAPAGAGAQLVLNPLRRPDVVDFEVKDGNVFALFGSINGASGPAASLGGATVITVNGDILVPASRVNGCIIGSAEGCVTTIVGNFVLRLPREVIAPIAGEEGAPVPFDPLVGTNNEGLFSDAATARKDDEDCAQRDAAGVCVAN